MTDTPSAPPLRDRFSGQVAIVTGAAQGIGFATARVLAEQGATVVVADIDAKRAESVAAAFSEQGFPSHAHAIDIADEAAVAALADETGKRYGRIDILAHLAAIYPFFPYSLDDLSLSDWRRVQEVNLDATFLLARAVLPHMRRRGYGRIVNTSSISVDTVGAPGLATYTASKAGVIGFTRVLAHEAGMDGITANVVMPGLIETDHVNSMLDSPAATAAFFDQHLTRQCVKRRGQPQDIAHCVAYLASPEAGFVTGQTINVGGGYSFA